MPRNETSWASARATLPPSWETAIGAKFSQPYMRALDIFVSAERCAGKSVLPVDRLVFAAFACTPLERVKAVILGQDPYYQPGQAMGLSFSVPPGVRLPPTLRNIFKEMAADIGAAVPSHGCLAAWADRGILLLNASLSVEQGKPGSHARAGWHRFTDRVLAAVSARRTPVAFILWGNDARKKASMLDGSRHLVHVSQHPSPLAAYRGFFGSRPFSKTNAFLASQGLEPIDWRLE